VDEMTVAEWINAVDVTAPTKCNRHNAIKKFADFAFPLGIVIAMPERPKLYSGYTPYLFNEDEMQRIFAAADNFEYKRYKTDAYVQVPVLLRILFGCGLRLGEAIRLKWVNVDLHEGTIRILDAKNEKQRLVPMHQSMTDILIKYKNLTYTSKNSSMLLFPNRHGGVRSFNGVQQWFSKLMHDAGIVYIKHRIHERGPCWHCIRHQFALESFSAADAMGVPFMDFVPYLSTYLGHSGIMETEKYLRANFVMYKEAQRKISEYTNHLFPEVMPYEED
jgi:integrase